jgi:hypothetical protein
MGALDHIVRFLVSLELAITFNKKKPHNNMVVLFILTNCYLG